MSGVFAFAMVVYASGISIRKAARGARLAWVAIIAIAVMITAYGCLLDGVLRSGHWTWELQAISAACCCIHVVALAGINWLRYSYLLESKNHRAWPGL